MVSLQIHKIKLEKMLSVSNTTFQIVISQRLSSFMLSTCDGTKTMDEKKDLFEYAIRHLNNDSVLSMIIKDNILIYIINNMNYVLINTYKQENIKKRISCLFVPMRYFQC